MCASEHPFCKKSIGQVSIQLSYFLSFFVTEPIDLVNFHISHKVSVLYVHTFINRFVAMETLIISDM
jgi:hypothetical protein